MVMVRGAPTPEEEQAPAEDEAPAEEDADGADADGADADGADAEVDSGYSSHSLCFSDDE